MQINLSELSKPVFSFDTEMLGTLQANPIYSLSYSDIHCLSKEAVTNNELILNFISFICTRSENNEAKHLKKAELKKITDVETDAFAKEYSEKAMPSDKEIPQNNTEEKSNVDFLCEQLRIYFKIKNKANQALIDKFTSELSFSSATTDRISKLIGDVTALDQYKMFSRTEMLNHFDSRKIDSDLDNYAKDSVPFNLNSAANIPRDKIHNPISPIIKNPIEKTNERLKNLENILNSMNSFVQNSAITQVEMANELKKSGDENSKFGSKNLWLSLAIFIMTFLSLVMTYRSIQDSNTAAQDFSIVLKHLDKNVEQVNLATLAISTTNAKSQLIFDKILNSLKKQPQIKDHQNLINELKQESVKNKLQLDELNMTIKHLKTRLNNLTDNN